MPRAFLVVMDSVGIGGAPDADQFFNGDVPDTGANTVAHIAQFRAQNASGSENSGSFLPHLDALGLGAAVTLASGVAAPGLDAKPSGTWGVATEVSAGKDTPSGHWELAGLPVPWEWHHFPDTSPAFPPDLVAAVCDAAETSGILGNCHASGTDIIAKHGVTHQQTGWPICYTSADSVFQIAAHEGSFGLDRLLALCAKVAPVLHSMNVGRVIARPFVGTEKDGFVRTGNRKDYAIAPPGDVLTSWVQNAGRRVYAVGKIGDIFSMQGIDVVFKGTDEQLMAHLDGLVDTAEEGSLTFANFVEFDSLYGHRRDIEGYAKALEWFDGAVGALLKKLKADDILILTADHGNDPSWTGTDHTRERVPVLVAGAGPGELGHIGFKDVAGIVLRHLQIASPQRG